MSTPSTIPSNTMSSSFQTSPTTKIPLKHRRGTSLPGILFRRSLSLANDQPDPTTHRFFEPIPSRRKCLLDGPHRVSLCNSGVQTRMAASIPRHHGTSRVQLFPPLHMHLEILPKHQSISFSFRPSHSHGRGTQATRNPQNATHSILTPKATHVQFLRLEIRRL